MRHCLARIVPLLTFVVAQGLTAQATDTSRTTQAGAAPRPVVGPPIRQISTASAVSKERIGSIMGVRELPDGRVLVNDGASRRLLLMDTMLVVSRVVLDSLSEQENTYGTRPGALLPHRGDSSLFIDPSSLALLVIDPVGNIARIRSVPRAQDMYGYASPSSESGQAATDSRGRLVYRKQASPAPPVKAPPRGVPWFPQEPDSAFIVALNLDTRKLDTLGSIRTPKSELIVRFNPTGGFNVNSSINPMPSTDEWAVLPDGAVAFVRGVDYRVEYRQPDGTWTSSPKLPYDWQPVSDEEKQRIVDSVRTVQSRNLRSNYVTSMIRWVNTYGRKYPPNFSAPEGYTPPNGFDKNWSFPANTRFPERYIYGCARGVEPTMIPEPQIASRSAAPQQSAAASPTPPPPTPQPQMAGAPGMPTRGTPSCIPQPIPNLAQVPNAPTLREVSVISPKLMPDFRPPFGTNSVRADLDGNLWVRTNQTRPIQGGAVYDVVSREGQLVDRLQLPSGYTLVGFGRGKVVFVSMRDASGIHLARVRLK